MSSDLEMQLVNGGVGPVAAKVISNAIENINSGRLTRGRFLEDSTPTAKMRLIDSNTRKYVLTNLDYSDRRKQPPTEYVAGNTAHPYEGSQPSSANPTTTTQTVKAGQFVAVSPSTTNGVAQSEVALNVANRGGTHARLNKATGEIESVPILVEIEPKNKVTATVEERPDATVIRLRFLQ